MYTETGAISPKLEQLRVALRWTRRWAWRLVLVFLLAHYASGVLHELLWPAPDFVLVKLR